MALVRSLLTTGAFGSHFPDECPDGDGTCGASQWNMGLALRAEIPELKWPLDEKAAPPTLAILDCIEFCYRTVATPIQGSFHPFYRHFHLTFDPDKGKAGFRDSVNRLFARGGLCYELNVDGRIIRTVPAEISAVLRGAEFRTGDRSLDELLDTARQKYFDADPKERKMGLDRLWDGWERLKTIEGGDNKKASAATLLDRAAEEPKLRATFEAEAIELTRIGNQFGIRHSEISQVELKTGADIDYFFHRLFAFVLMLLKKTGRV